ncbi:MAG: hypothetical protein ABS916_03705 [Carnobacterium sp.]|uniref:hypothetical protein n=1 Tax=Carnobacterium sp. TaxID=48221 RepID=UPI0033160703
MKKNHKLIEHKWVVKLGKGYFSGYDETKVTYVIDDMPGALDGRIVYNNLHEAKLDANNIGGQAEEVANKL